MSKVIPNQPTDTPAAGDSGAKFYEHTLRARLEPGQNGQFVAIHADTGDYAVADTSGNALRALYARHPEGGILVRRIGSEPEYGLAARVLAGDRSAGQAA